MKHDQCQEKLFNILDSANSNVLGGSVTSENAYITMHAAIQAGEKRPQDLEIGESTRAEYRVSGTRPTTYCIVRIQ
jgi:hypothetical protein